MNADAESDGFVENQNLEFQLFILNLLNPRRIISVSQCRLVLSDGEKMGIVEERCEKSKILDNIF